MLRRFEVKNFKNFRDNFVFDFTDIKNYAFNPECVDNNIVSKALVYGPNGCGKSNLGHAIFDITTHLTDDKIDSTYDNYLNAASNSDLAEFVYTFQFGNAVVEYKYGKKSVEELVYEIVTLNGMEVIALDRRQSDIATVKLKGAETLNRDLSTNNKISAIKYVRNNAVLKENLDTQAINSFYRFASFMKLVKTIDSHKTVSSNPTDYSSMILEEADGLKKFERFLNNAGAKCILGVIEVNGKERIAFDFGLKKIDFFQLASTGTLCLCRLYISLRILRLKIEVATVELKAHLLKCELKNTESSNPVNLPFIFIDEFDAFYHHAASKMIVKELKAMDAQVVLTTHNTSIMSNDLLRPDCYFIMSETDIKPMHRFTEKELRKAHNIEKMYRAGAFNE